MVFLFILERHPRVKSIQLRTRMQLWSATLLMMGMASTLEIRPGRLRRDLLDLADMFDLVTGLDPSDYIPYGNWCGYGGKGKPIDRIDGCCHVHDACYGDCEVKCSSEKIVHVVQYEWKIVNDTIVCRGDDSSCEFSVCTCDREVVECISEHRHTYSEHYRFIRKSR